MQLILTILHEVEEAAYASCCGVGRGCGQLCRAPAALLTLPLHGRSLQGRALKRFLLLLRTTVRISVL